MAANTMLRNPYIAGRSLGQQQGFFGREDVFQLVEGELALPERNAVVLFGQRRIGKTSILLQLRRRLAALPFLPVYFDLMDRARQALGQVLFELASTIAAEAEIAPPRQDAFDDHGVYFRQEFLPALYAALGESRRPVLLLDEFDVLDIAAEERLPPTAAARVFFPYLRQLMQGEPRLGFIFVVGRKAEELSTDFKATFKAARFKRVSVLDERSARDLILTAERQGALRFAPAAVERILALTSGHPYFIQLICQILWENAYDSRAGSVATIEVGTIEAILPKALEAGENIFEWVWDGLPPAERVVFAAIAEATRERHMVTEEQLLDLLQRHGIRILTRQLELAPATLVEWDMLRKTEGGYTFFIELMRRWAIERKPLPRVKDELDRIVPLADTLYRSADAFYRQSDAESALDQLRKALRANPNHLKARLLLGQILLGQGTLDESVRELEEAYRYDEDAARYPLIQALLVYGAEQERRGNEDDALVTYDRVLEVSPHEKVAQERRTTIWVRRGDMAVKRDDLTAALEAFVKSGVREKIAQIEPLQRKREMQQAVTQAEMYERQENWDRAIEIYQWLMTKDPVDQQWHEALANAKAAQSLIRQYNNGIDAIKQRDWRRAMRVFADVVYIRPDYRDAATYLATAVREQRNAAPIEAALHQEPHDLASQPERPSAESQLSPDMRRLLAGLSQILAQSFNEYQLRDLYQDLRIDYNNIAGEGRAMKARGLVAYCIRQGRGDELVEASSRLRPDLAGQILSLLPEQPAATRLRKRISLRK